MNDVVYEVIESFKFKGTHYKKGELLMNPEEPLKEFNIEELDGELLLDGGSAIEIEKI